MRAYPATMEASAMSVSLKVVKCVSIQTRNKKIGYSFNHFGWIMMRRFFRLNIHVSTMKLLGSSNKSP